jgi:hypothetical protein
VQNVERLFLFDNRWRVAVVKPDTSDVTDAACETLLSMARPECGRLKFCNQTG